MSKSTAERVDDVFVQCSAKSDSATGCCDFRGVVVVFWSILDNTLSLIDIAGVYAVTTPGDTLDASVFVDFFSGISRLKFPSGTEYKEKMLDLLRDSKPLPSSANSTLFGKIMDKNVMKLLLKFDLPLRRCFGSFAGKNISFGGNLTWEEVKKNSIGMEIDGFIAFSSFYSIVPAHLSVQQVDTLVKDVLKSYPVSRGGTALNSVLFFPQFQLLLGMLAMEKIEASNKRASSMKRGTFARKIVDVDTKPFVDIVLEFFKSIGIDKGKDISGDSKRGMATIRSSSPVQGIDNRMNARPVSAATEISHDADSRGSTADDGKGRVKIPVADTPMDQYASTMNHSRQAMLMRMEHLFDEIESKLLPIVGSDTELMQLLAASQSDKEINEAMENKGRITSKPVVIADAVPVPLQCPEIAEQLLQAALAHHNLGNFTESLKFLEAARLQLIEIQRRINRSKRLVASQGVNTDEVFDAPEAEENDYSEISLDLDMYIGLCKGNVYQSCGDDEQSLLQYMEALNNAMNKANKDWEIVTLNSIGTLAYYSLRYDVALMCFYTVALYRSSSYGEGSADTATAWNNEGACLYCLNKRKESRIKFEKSWSILCDVLGHRAPRAVVVWKNLEKARRANASLTRKDLSESASLRPDADRLLLGGSFLIKAIAPAESKGKKKKGGKKKKK